MDNLLTLFDLPEPAPLMPIVSKLRRILIYDRAEFGHYQIDRVAYGRVSLYLVYKNGYPCKPFRFGDSDKQLMALALFVAWRVNSARDIRIIESAAYDNQADVRMLCAA